MLSWRLWNTLAEPLIKNPIFNRVRDEATLRRKPKEPLTIPKYMYVIVALFILLGILRAPHILVMFIQVPVVLMVALILSPLMMPLFVIFVGSYMVTGITSDINKEKRQYTYELLCASPHGSLNATWAFATGILHRGNWFNWVKLLTTFTYRTGKLLLAVFSVMVFLSMFSSEPSARIEAIHTLINLSLLIAIYYTGVFQPVVLSFIVGLYASSLDLSRRDSSIIGLVMYLMQVILPYVLAFVLFVLIQTALPAPHPIAKIGLDIIILSSIFISRELMVNLMWWQLKRLLDSSSDYILPSPQMASVHS